MDVGVGVFIVSSAITSRYARGAVVPTQRSSSWFPSYQRFLVLLLGFGRLLVIKALGYQEHVSEYGVHWNFFMTLFTVWTVADLLHRCCSSSSSSLGVTVTSNTTNPSNTNSSNNTNSNNNSNTNTNNNSDSAGHSSPVPLPLPPLLILSIALLSVYQFFLANSSSSWLTSFLLSNDPLLRTTTNTVSGVLTANKEGVFSLCGYLPLYLSSEWLASVLFFSRGNNSSRHDHQSDDEKEEKDKEEDVDKPGGHGSNSSNPLVSCIKRVLPSSLSLSSPSFRVVWRLFQVSFFLWSFWWFSSHFIQATSRRLCNLSYVSLVLALSFSLLFSLALAERIIPLFVVPSFPPSSSSSSPLLSSQSGLSSLYFMNKHSILVFLAANLLTGAVNLTVPTIHTPDGVAVMVLSIYSFLVTGSAWLAEYLLH
jgi:hypothetical protein